MEKRLVQAAAETINFIFHQRREVDCTAELNNHTPFFLMWQKVKDEDFMWNRCAEAVLIQNVHLYGQVVCERRLTHPLSFLSAVEVDKCVKLTAHR